MKEKNKIANEKGEKLSLTNDTIIMIDFFNEQPSSLK